MPHSHGEGDIYDEYIWVTNRFEKIGSTDIDLSDYLQTGDIADWAKAATKPSYTAAEVGALPSNTYIPTKVSDLTNDSGYLTEHQDISGKANAADLATVATSGNYNDLSNKPTIPTKVSDLTDDSDHYIKPSGGIPASDLADGVVPVEDVQVNGTSILDEQGVANVQAAATDTFGVVKVATNGFYGIKYYGDNNKFLVINAATSSEIKRGGLEYHPIVAARQHMASFYGLAKAAGDTTQSASSNAVGTYTEEAKSAISEMLGGSVAVSGTAPTINAKAGIRYVCGEVSTLDITLPESGIVDVVFESGSTPTVLTITPPTGQTVKWANGFDPASLDADMVYEINIMDGLGVAGSWN